jgi:predicted dehydrogenase
MFRVGIVGVGAIGREHLHIYQSLPDVTVVGVADSNESAAKEVAQLVGARAYASTAELLEDQEVDAISLCTPDDRHYEDAKRVIKAGKHLLLEKPIATTVHEADHLVTLAESSDRCIMPGHTLRFEGMYVAAKALVAEGKIGDIVHGYVRRNNIVSVAERIGGRTSATFFLGIHDIDALTWITGSRVAEVQAMESTQRTPDGQQAVAVEANLRLEGGAVVQLEAAWGMPNGSPSGIDARFRLVGESGELSFDIHDFGMRLFSGVATLPRPTAFPIYGVPQGALAEEIASFVRVACSGVEAPVTMRHAADAVRVAAAIDEAIKLDKAITIAYP